jgi:hypothetical protein
MTIALLLSGPGKFALQRILGMEREVKFSLRSLISAVIDRIDDGIGQVPRPAIKEDLSLFQADNMIGVFPRQL